MISSFEYFQESQWSVPRVRHWQHTKDAKDTRQSTREVKYVRTTVRYEDWRERKCRYFLNYFPCQLMSGDAWKPKMKSQTRCTQYTQFWIKNMLFYYKNWRIFHFFDISISKNVLFSLFHYIYQISHEI